MANPNIEKWNSDELRRYDQIKMLVYGDSGVGKTVFASTAPSPLFLDADKGMMSVQNVVDRIPIDNWSDLQEAWTFIASGEHEYKTIVVDALNELQRIVMDSVIDKFNVRRMYEDQPTMADWGKALNDFTNMIRMFVSLPYNVIFIAHASPRVFEEDRVLPQLNGKQTANLLTRYMDIVGFMYVQASEVRIARFLGFDLANAITKDRSWKLPPVLPDPTWDKMQEILEAK